MSVREKYKGSRFATVYLAGGFAVYLRPPNQTVAMLQNPIRSETYQAIKEAQVKRETPGADMLRKRHNDFYCWLMGLLAYSIIPPPPEVVALPENEGKTWIHRIVIDPAEGIGENDVYHEDVSPDDLDYIGGRLVEMLGLNRKEAERIAPFHGTGHRGESGATDELQTSGADERPASVPV